MIISINTLAIIVIIAVATTGHLFAVILAMVVIIAVTAGHLFAIHIAHMVKKARKSNYLKKEKQNLWL
ncbi:MAG: hypothetical protein LBU29_04410 [Endomicrobium sp.]|nr:hypothetical protein [Endomicrobium sp.]